MTHVMKKAEKKIESAKSDYKSQVEVPLSVLKRIVSGLLHFWVSHHHAQNVRFATSRDGATFVQHRSLVGLRYKRDD